VTSIYTPVKNYGRRTGRQLRLSQPTHGSHHIACIANDLPNSAETQRTSNEGLKALSKHASSRTKTSRAAVSLPSRRSPQTLEDAEDSTAQFAPALDDRAARRGERARRRAASNAQYRAAMLSIDPSRRPRLDARRGAARRAHLVPL